MTKKYDYNNNENVNNYQTNKNSVVLMKLKAAIIKGEEERRSLEKNIQRLRLSKVIEALRELNECDHFNDALESLVKNLTVFSGAYAFYFDQPN